MKHTAPDTLTADNQHINNNMIGFTLTIALAVSYLGLVYTIAHTNDNK